MSQSAGSRKSRRPSPKNLNTPSDNPKNSRNPFHGFALFAAIGLCFLSASEPNISMRYGPLLVLAIFIFSGPAKFRLRPTDLTLSLYIIWVLASGTWAVDFEQYRISSLAAVSSAFAFVALRGVRWRLSDLLWIVAGYLAGLATGLINMFVSPEATDRIQVGDRITQTGDVNVNYLAYAAVAALVMLIVLLGPLKDTISLTTRNFFLLAALLPIIGIFASQTRGAVLATGLIALWGLWSLLSPPPYARFIVLVTSLAGLSLALISGLVDSLLYVLDFGSRTTDGLSGRLNIWPYARSLWADNPLLGIGAGGFRTNAPFGTTSHNSVLEVGSTLGIIGLILICFVFGLFFRENLRSTGQIKKLLFSSGILCIYIAAIYLPSTWILSHGSWTALAIIGLLIEHLQKTSNDQTGVVILEQKRL